MVYSATDLKLERRVLVRLLDPSADESERDRFNRESKILGRLSAHPNVVTVYETGFVPGGRPFLVTELIDGKTLAELMIRDGVLQWEAAADIILQLCAGLDQAHRSGALHRDLRPETVLMAGMTPKLSDFAISAIGSTLGEGSGAEADSAAIAHRAPETLDNVWDERTDLYSLASMLYELIDGHPPFWRPGTDSVDAARLRLLHESPPALDPEQVPMALSVFVSAALSKDPFDRPQSADEFAHELQLIREGRTTGSTPSVLHGTTTTMALPIPPPPASPPGSPQPAIPGRPAEPATATPAPAPAVASAPLMAPLPPEPVLMSPALMSPAVMSPSAPVQEGPAGFAPPVEQWAPPAGPESGHTAVYSQFDAAAAPPPAGFDNIAPPAPSHDGNGIAGHDQSGHGQPDDRAQLIGGVYLDDERPTLSRRPAAFTAAMAMIAIGLIGLLAVVALSALGSDDDQQTSAPALPDPNQPAPVDAGAGVTGDASGTTVAGDGEAMAEEMTETTQPPAEQASTSQTTIARLAVPNMVGLDVETATRRLSDAGFQVLVVGRKATNALPGVVAQQKPDAGSMVAIPLTVTLYIPRVSNLPAMVGRSAVAVCLELQALSLTCNRTLQNNDQIPAGSVIATSPVEGALFSEGSSVELIVSRGPVTTVAVPDVTGQTRAEAEATIMAAGFTIVAYTTQPSDTIEMERAVATNPATGALLPTDQPVTVLISSGPPAKIVLPELTGMTAAEAETRLSALGLTTTITLQDRPAGDPGIGMVLSMAPAAGSEVATGAAVAITVGQAEPEVTTTTTMATTTSVAESTTTAGG